MTDPAPVAPSEPTIPPTKFDTERTEFWLTGISVVGTTLAAILGSKSEIVPWISLASLVLTVTIYTILRTPLVSLDKPGIKTKAFWSAIAVVVTSVATAVADADVPGIPPGITKGASIAVAALTAAGYTAIRYRAKNATARVTTP